MPRIKPAQMGGQWRNDGAWCPGCGLHAHVIGEHRDDCTAGHHGHLAAEECTDRCTPEARARRLSTRAIHSGEKPLHDGPDTRASPNP